MRQQFSNGGALGLELRVRLLTTAKPEQAESNPSQQKHREFRDEIPCTSSIIPVLFCRADNNPSREKDREFRDETL